LQIAIGKGRKQWEKRDKIKKHDMDREIERLVRQKI
jgi:tmRNA-binding protein